MALKTTRFAVLDTAVYIENLRTGRFTIRIFRNGSKPWAMERAEARG